jgi:DNA-binding XRE family transcriptional regulator
MPQSITLDQRRYVIIPEEEYDRLSRAARLPVLPEPNADGNYPAIEYARASLARKIILRREALGWTQAELARRSGVRVETLCRVETGKVTPALGTVDKLDRALRAGEGRSARRGRLRRG